MNSFVPSCKQTLWIAVLLFKVTWAWGSVLVPGVENYEEYYKSIIECTSQNDFKSVCNCYEVAAREQSPWLLDLLRETFECKNNTMKDLFGSCTHSLLTVSGNLSRTVKNLLLFKPTPVSQEQKVLEDELKAQFVELSLLKDQMHGLDNNFKKRMFACFAESIHDNLRREPPPVPFETIHRLPQCVPNFRDSQLEKKSEIRQKRVIIQRKIISLRNKLQLVKRTHSLANHKGMRDLISNIQFLSSNLENMCSLCNHVEKCTNVSNPLCDKVACIVHKIQD